MVYRGEESVSYEQQRPEEVVKGTIHQDQRVVVQVEGEYHFVKDGKCNVESPILQEEVAKNLAEERSSSYTKYAHVQKAILELAGASEDDFDIGWEESNNNVKAVLLPDAFGDFQVDKTATWGEPQPGNNNHALICNETGEAYCNLVSNIAQDWYGIDSGMVGETLVASFPKLREEDLVNLAR